MITIELILITFTLVMGLKIALSEGMLLEQLGYYCEMKVKNGYKMFDLLICPWCSNSWLSLVAYGFAFGLNILPLAWNWQLVIRWPLVVMGASFLSGNAWNTYETINAIKEKNKLECECLDKWNEMNDVADYEQQQN